MKRSLKLYVSGNVQGVFYRKFIEEKAIELGVNGFVRNLEDGRVEIFLEGDNEKVEKMKDICKQGSKFSQVKGIEIKEERFQDFKDFRIIHF